MKKAKRRNGISRSRGKSNGSQKTQTVGGHDRNIHHRCGLHTDVHHLPVRSIRSTDRVQPDVVDGEYVSMAETLLRRIRGWKKGIPDPADSDCIGDSLELQIIVELKDGCYISGHWDMSADKWMEVFFVPDFMTKELIENEDIARWMFVRDIG